MDVVNAKYLGNAAQQSPLPDSVRAGLKGWFLSFTQRILIALVLAAFGAGLTVWAVYLANQATQERRQGVTAQNSIAIKAALNANIQADIEALNLWAKYFQTVTETGSSDTIQAQFSEMATDFFDQANGFQALAYAPLVSLTDRAQYLQQLNPLTGQPKQILEYTQAGDFRDALETDQAFPIDQVDSFAGVELSMGLDLASNPVWLEALFQARDSRLPVAIATAFNGSMDYWVLQPLFHGSEIERIMSPVGGLSGYLLAVSRTREALHAYLEDHVTDNMQIVLRDSILEDMSVSHSDQAIADTGHAPSDLLELTSSSISFAGRELLLDIYALPFKTNWWSGQRVYISLIGLLLTSLLIFLFWLITGRTLQIQALVYSRTEELSNAYEQLKESQVHLVQSEKMASLGQMVAGFAHEVNTPLAYAKGSFDVIAQQLLVYQEQDQQVCSLVAAVAQEELHQAQDNYQQLHALLDERRHTDQLGQSLELLSVGISGLEEIQELVKNLKNFSRLDRANIVQYDLSEGLDSTLVILRNQLDSQICIHKEYTDFAPVMCAPSQINQVFLNMINNAAQAIEGPGNIYLRVDIENGSVVVEIEDDGVGIDDENLNKIMDPFFTTKEIGQGTGLGLSICHKIIQQHDGAIEVHSELGVGTLMRIILPRSESSRAA